MDDAKIIEMLEELVEEIDYDIYKALFVPECREDDEEAQAQIDQLVKIVRNHL